jgi:hypothetical protein
MKKATKATKTAKTEQTEDNDVMFRVWKLTPEARAAIKSLRGTKQLDTNKDVLDAACANTLPRIVESLLNIGCSSLVAKKQTFRLGMSPSTMAALKDASEATGQDVSALFLLCVNALVTDAPKARKTQKGAK